MILRPRSLKDRMILPETVLDGRRNRVRDVGRPPLEFFLNPYRFAGGTPPPTDPDFASVTSLLHLNGANGSAIMTDQKGVAWTAQLGARISTAESVFGGASCAFDGTTNGYFASNTSAGAAAFGTGAFTAEMWIRPTSLANSYGALLANGSALWANNNRFICLFGSGSGVSGQIGVGGYDAKTAGGGSYQPAGNPLLLSTTTLSVNNWYHVAVTSDGAGTATLRLFINGTLENSNTSTAAWNFDATNCRIGANGWDSTNGCFTGFMDDIRLTTGVCRYTANFTPPAAQFPDS